MKKKGFTLVELLGTIVILVTILLITAPTVFNAINNSKKASDKNQEKLLISYAKLWQADNDYLLSDEIGSEYKLYVSDLIISGYVQDADLYNIERNEVLDNACIYIRTEKNKYKYIYEENCGFKTYDNGTIVYYNPIENKICNLDSYNSDLKSYLNQSGLDSATGQKEGCMKWYLFNEEEDDFYRLILDHNTTAKSYWNYSGLNSNIGILPKEEIGTDAQYNDIMYDFYNDTINWSSEINKNIFTLDRLYKLTGNSLDIPSSLSFLYDNTNSSNCNSKDSDVSGYWLETSVSDSDNEAWVVDSSGKIIKKQVNDINYGIRFVISIDKTSLK